MSAVTLDDLYEYYVRDFEAWKAVGKNSGLFKRQQIAFGTYAVARSHGLEAAMLYKLSDGAIDPRKADDDT